MSDTTGDGDVTTPTDGGDAFEDRIDDSDAGPIGRVLGRGMAAEAAEQYRVVLAAYQEARRRHSLRPTLLVEYRCRRRCLLLHCWMSPHGRYIVLPPYRWSPDRARTTVDGHRFRAARAIHLDDAIEVSGLPLLPLDCNHVSQYVEPETVLAEAMSTRPGRPRVVRIPRSSKLS